MKAEEKLAEDPRLRGDELCRVTRLVGGVEFICIRKVHAKMYTRHRSSPIGAPIESNNPEADRHYMVRRYPIGDH